jgi:hypothetical protein
MKRSERQRRNSLALLTINHVTKQIVYDLIRIIATP